MANLYRIQDNFNDLTFTDDVHDTDPARTYLPIRRTTVTTSGDLRKNTMTITIPVDFADQSPWKEYHSVGHSYGRVKLKLTESVGNTMVFQGFLHTVTLSASTLSLNFSMPLLPVEVSTRRFHTLCPYLLFDPNTCKASESAFVMMTTATVDTTKAVVTLATAIPDSSARITDASAYKNGTVKWNNVRFWIENVNDAGNIITLRAPLVGFTDGSNIEVYPTCDKALSTCKDRFNNAENFGGMPTYSHQDSLIAELNDDKTSFLKDLTQSTEIISRVQIPSVVSQDRDGTYTVSLPDGESRELTAAEYQLWENSLLKAFVLERSIF